MIVIVIESAPLQIRGILQRWMLEPKAGVFVGNPNALVREKIWSRIIKYQDQPLNALMIYSTNNEQGYSIEIIGNPRKTVIDLDGIKLIKTL